MTKTNVSLRTMKTMKKYSILLSAALAVFALASCQKEQDNSVKEVIDDTPKSVPFVLRADIPSVDTKTTLNTDTWALGWEDTDIIYAVTTDEAWGEAYPVAADETIAEFVYDSEKGTFSTDMEIADGGHTFNFLYTASQQKSYHRGASTTFQLAGTQAFDASNPTASLKLYDALAAQVAATIPTTFANVEMSHLFSLMKVTLKNKTGADVTVSKFEIEIPGEKLHGIFNVNFNNTPSTTFKSGGGDKITVNISNGTIPSAGTLDLYFVMGAVSDYTGEVTFTVTDSASNTYTKTNTISAPGVTFAAGTYNTASYTLKAADPIEYVTLDWDYAGGTASDLNAVPGVTTSGLGSDYASSHAPYRVKFDGTGDYIQIRTDAAISSVSVGFKKIGGDGISSLTIKESANGSDWTDVQTFTLTGDQNYIGTVTTTNLFNTSSRFVQIYFTRVANVGIGAISITKVNTDPVINADDISDVPAVGGSSLSHTYTVSNFVDDVEVASVSGCVSAAVAGSGEVLYDVDPNYESSPATGTIVLQSAADNSVTKTIDVNQLASSLSVSDTEIIIPADADEAQFTITSPEFGWSISADDDSHIDFDDTGSASPSASTVSITSDITATDAVQTIATLTIIRNGNASDPQKKQVVVKKDKVGGSSTTKLTNANIVSAGDADSGYTSLNLTDGNGNNYTAYAIKNKHSNATSSYHYLQIKKYASSTAYYIQIPELGTKITSITMTVSSTNQPMTGGGNSATLYFSNSNSTSAAGTGVASGTGASSVTINCSSLNLNTGYITASGAVRIWDIEIAYDN